MLIKKLQTRQKVNSKTCRVFEYDFHRPNLGVAQVEINGNYPEYGWAMNKESDQIIYCLTGKLVVECNQDKYELGPDDAVFIDKGDKYWLNGQCVLVVINSPEWTLEQYCIIR
ncbi:MAG: hypothetical protein WC570_00325 [Patescibacteria group bacterium]